MVGREVLSLLLACSAGSELLYMGKVSQASQESQITGSKNCPFPSWCSFLLITPAFPLSHLPYACTVLHRNQTMLWINYVHAQHLQYLYPLLCILPLVGRVQASLPYSSHCAAALFLWLSPFSCCFWGIWLLHLHVIISCCAFLLHVDSCVLASRLLLIIHSETL